MNSIHPSTRVRIVGLLYIITTETRQTLPRAGEVRTETNWGEDNPSRGQGAAHAYAAPAAPIAIASLHLHAGHTLARKSPRRWCTGHHAVVSNCSCELDQTEQCLVSRRPVFAAVYRDNAPFNSSLLITAL